MAVGACVLTLSVGGGVRARQLAFFTVRTEEKNAMLLWVLRELLPRDQQAIVFTCTRHHVEFVHNFLKQVRRAAAS